MRRVLPVSLLALAAAACSSGYEVDVEWTIDGDEPAVVCDALPAGTEVVFTISSRDTADSRDARITDTTETAQCNSAAATITTGPFADVVTELRAGDVTVGAAPSFSAVPGGPDQGYGDVPAFARVDLRVTQSSVDAELTVVGQSCGDAGADSFTVTLFENSEPRDLVPVDGAIDVEVACDDGSAVFHHEGLRAGQRYAIQATATVGGTSYSTASSGEGFVAVGARTFTTIDLQAR